MSLIIKVAAVMEKIAPLALADTTWDNVGVLVECPEPNRNHAVLLTIDFTKEVLEECLEKKVEVVLAYHPPIFRPLKRLTLSDMKTNLILRAVRAGMSIYSPHTALDACEGGINDWLVSLAVGETDESHPIVPKGLKGKEEEETVDQEEARHEKKEKEPIKTGYGRVARLTRPLTIAQVVANVKKGLRLSSVRLALPSEWTTDNLVRHIAVCAGSGGSVFQNLPFTADLLLTGEMGHHEVLAANQQDQAVLLCEHTNTERGYLGNVLLAKLHRALGGNTTVHLSELDRDPLVAC